MTSIELEHPIYTLDRRPLLAAGEKLSPKVWNALIGSGGTRPPRTVPFLKDGPARRDLLRSLREPPYDVFFGERETACVLDVMRAVRCVPPVLDFLDHFKTQDHYTYRHALMVFALSTVLARDLLGGAGDLIAKAMAGAVHDFGKICVPLDILKKSNPLTRTSRRVIEHHALAGYVLLGYVHRDPRRFAAKVAKDHHERRDGTGYPRGIFLREPMVDAIAVCDVYDALLSPRPYRPQAYEHRAAVEELTALSRRGTLGRMAVQALISHVRKEKPPFRTCRISLEKRGTPPARNLYGVFRDDEPGAGKGKTARWRPRTLTSERPARRSRS